MQTWNKEGDAEDKMDMRCFQSNHSSINTHSEREKSWPCVFNSRMYISGALCCSAGYVTSPFITPHGQLSAEGKMEVVSWGPAGQIRLPLSCV